jgi:hypothetical protein
MMTFSVLLDEFENKNIQDNIPSIRYKRGQELECRFGSFNERGIFNPGVSQKDFYRLLDNLRKSSEYTEKNPVETNVSYYKLEQTDYRMIETIKNGQVVESLVQDKQRLRRVDTNLFPYSVRLALSVEKNITDKNITSKILAQNPQNMKKQLRYIFLDKNNNYEIHLSEIYKSNKFNPDIKEKSFEVEVECKDDFFLRVDRNTKAYNYLIVMKKVYYLLTDRFSTLAFSFKKEYLDDIRDIVQTLYNNSNKYIRFTKGNKVVDNRPISLYHNNLSIVRDGNFAVTNKLDGEFYNLVVSSKGIFLVNSVNIDILATEDEIEDIPEFSNTTIMLGELYKGKFYAFDSIVVNGQNVYDKPLLTRLQIAEPLLKRINEMFEGFAQMKPFFASNDINKNINSCLNYMQNTFGQNYIEHNDGLIFTNINKGSMDTTYKWKFPEKISIDGKLKIKEENEKQKIFQVLFGLDKNFSPLQSNPLLKVSSDSPFYNILRSNLIVELAWKDNDFHVDRIRYDKYYPNYITVAEETFIQMKNPISLDELLQKAMPFADEEIKNKRYRDFCNLIKKYLITTYSDNNILDLGAGVGGDLQKYNIQFKKNKLKQLFLVEPFLFSGLQERIKEFRIKDDNFVNSIKSLNAKAEDKDLIQNFLENAPIDVINMMFSLTFFGAEDELIKLCNTLSLLKNDGLFVVAYMDGDRTLETLRKNNGIVQGSFYKITDVDYTKTSNPRYNLVFGHKIHFSFKGVSVTEQGQDEYLLPANLMRQKFSLCTKGYPGLKFSKGLFFDQLVTISNSSDILQDAVNLYEDMSTEEKDLVKLFRFDIYKKIMYKEQEKEQIERQNVLSALEVSDKPVREEIRLNFQNQDETFYRLAVAKDGSCFFHAVLQASLFKKYLSFPLQKRFQLISFIREMMAQNYKLSIWTNVNKGYSAVNQLNEKIFKLVKSDDQKKLIEAINSLDQNTNTYFKDYKEKLESLNLNINIRSIAEKCVAEIKQEYAKTTEWIRGELIEYLCNALNLNIFIISDLTRDVYLGLNIKYKPENQSIILLNLDGKYGKSSPHFETIAVVKNKIFNSIFSDEDELIHRLLKRIQTPSIRREEIITEEVEEIKEVEETIEDKQNKQERQELEEYLTSVVEQFFMYKELKLEFEYLSIKKDKKDIIQEEKEEEIEIPYQISEEQEKKQYVRNYKKIKKDYKLTDTQMDDITFQYILEFHLLTISQKQTFEKMIKDL